MSLEQYQEAVNGAIEVIKSHYKHTVDVEVIDITHYPLLGGCRHAHMYFGLPDNSEYQCIRKYREGTYGIELGHWVPTGKTTFDESHMWRAIAQFKIVERS